MLQQLLLHVVLILSLVRISIIDLDASRSRPPGPFKKNHPRRSTFPYFGSIVWLNCTREVSKGKAGRFDFLCFIPGGEGQAVSAFPSRPDPVVLETEKQQLETRETRDERDERRETRDERRYDCPSKMIDKLIKSSKHRL